MRNRECETTRIETMMGAITEVGIGVDREDIVARSASVGRRQRVGWSENEKEKEWSSVE